jgi:hypothetical protein
MATKAVNKARISWAYQQLLHHKPTHRLVAELSAREGISARQARRIVGAAAEEMVRDLDHIERPAMLGRFVSALETTIEQSLAAGQFNATIGAVRTLADLLHFPKPTASTPQSHQFTGRRYG